MNTHPPSAGVTAALQHLFDLNRKPDGRPFSNQDVVEGIKARGGPALSRQYVHALRTGKKTNPTLEHLKALADFFDTNLSAFADTPEGEEIRSQLHLLHVIKNNDVKALALRANNLSPQDLHLVADFVERLTTK